MTIYFSSTYHFLVVENKVQITFGCSFSCRYYYDGDMISKVQGKRFVYKFVCDLKSLIGYTASELNSLVIEAEQRALGSISVFNNNWLWNTLNELYQVHRHTLSNLSVFTHSYCYLIHKPHLNLYPFHQFYDQPKENFTTCYFWLQSLTIIYSAAQILSKPLSQHLI